MEIQQYFKTSDFYLAVTLQSLGEPMVEIEPGVKKTFVFPVRKTLRPAVDNYYRGNLKVDPQALWMNHKIVKNRLNAC